jgi:hypothetical protein
MNTSKILAVSVLLSSLMLTACGGGGSSPSTPPVVVSPPTLSVSASTKAAVVSDQVTLTWTGTNVSNCAISGSASYPSVTASGTQVVVPSVAGKNTYTITCGATTASTSVQVIPTSVAIPDTNFQTALNAMGYTVTSGHMDGHMALTIKQFIISNVSYDVSTASNPLYYQYAYYKTSGSTYIADATGLESFVNLTDFRLENQQIATVNLTQLSNLKTMSLWGEPLASINLSGNTSLTSLGLSETALTTVDTSMLTNLVEVDYQQSPVAVVPYVTTNGTHVVGFASINVASNTKLQKMFVEYNPITTLNLTTNPQVTTLDALDCTSLTTVTNPLWVTSRPATVQVPAGVVFN